MTIYSNARVWRFAEELAEAATSKCWPTLTKDSQLAWVRVAETAIAHGAIPPKDPVEEKAEELYNIWRDDETIRWENYNPDFQNRFRRVATYLLEGS